MTQIIPFAELDTADLIVDAVYEGGNSRSMSADPIAKLFPGAGNQGGFRQVGTRLQPFFVVLSSNLDDPEWPDFLDPYTGIFTYFGDNKKVGKELHKTPRGGNALLQRCFAALHDHPNKRSTIPPFLVFTRGLKGRDVVFRGLAAPGVNGVTDDLVAVWRSSNGERFQNYRALFSVLDVGTVKREWLTTLIGASSVPASAPVVWQNWVRNGLYSRLTSEPVVNHRSKFEQLPRSGKDQALIAFLYNYFKEQPTAFESCAARLASMLDPNLSSIIITPPTVDGGRDAIGKYLIGPIGDRVGLNFCLEAKCYAPDNGVGVKELSRLISRLRHREFGILVTTSFLSRQAYQELRFDGHPVIVIAAIDIAAILTAAGISTPILLQRWLEGA